MREYSSYDEKQTERGDGEQEATEGLFGAKERLGLHFPRLHAGRDDRDSETVEPILHMNLPVPSPDNVVRAVELCHGN